jgi:integrase
MLQMRMASNDSLWVFPGGDNKAFLATSLDNQHSKVREKLGLPKDFVLHSFRHSMLTRLGEAGVDAFTIMRIAGHSSVKVSERYVHPSAESLERGFERLEAFNKAALAAEEDGNRPAPATISATSEDLTSASHQQATLIQ